VGTQKKVYRQPNKAGAKMNADGYYADDAPDEDFDLSFLED